MARGTNSFVWGNIAWTEFSSDNCLNNGATESCEPYGVCCAWYDYAEGQCCPYCTHPGIDIPMPIGTTLYAAVDGTVMPPFCACYGPDFLWIWDEIHNKTIIYGHISARLATPGNRISKGQQIASSGVLGTGPHLHFEVRDGYGSAGCSLDPMPWLQGNPPSGWSTGGLPSPSQPPPAEPSDPDDLSVGDFVELTDSLNFRSSASLSASILYVVPAGQQGEITEKSGSTDGGFKWVKWKNGYGHGYSITNYFNRISAPSNQVIHNPTCDQNKPGIYAVNEDPGSSPVVQFYHLDSDAAGDWCIRVTLKSANKKQGVQFRSQENFGRQGGGVLTGKFVAYNGGAGNPNQCTMGAKFTDGSFQGVYPGSTSNISGTQWTRYNMINNYLRRDKTINYIYGAVSKNNGPVDGQYFVDDMYVYYSK
jgi:hypothetical protein